MFAGIEFMNMLVRMHYKDTSSSWVNNRRAVAKMTSQIMKYGKDGIIQNGQM